ELPRRASYDRSAIATGSLLVARSEFPAARPTPVRAARRAPRDRVAWPAAALAHRPGPCAPTVAVRATRAVDRATGSISRVRPSWLAAAPRASRATRWSSLRTH